MRASPSSQPWVFSFSKNLREILGHSLISELSGASGSVPLSWKMENIAWGVCMWHTGVSGSRNCPKVTLRENSQPAEKAIRFHLFCFYPQSACFRVNGMQRGTDRKAKAARKLYEKLQAWDCCLFLCCFNLLSALPKEAFVSTAINFSALCVYGFGFNRKDINIYFSSIFSITCSAQTTATSIITTLGESYYGAPGLSGPGRAIKTASGCSETHH